MSYKASIDVQSRSIYLLDGGDDNLSGSSFETAKATIPAAIAAANALIPFPSFTNPATIISFGSSLINEAGLVFLSSVDFNGPQTRIERTGGIASETIARIGVSKFSMSSIATDSNIASTAFEILDGDTNTFCEFEKVSAAGIPAAGIKFSGDTSGAQVIVKSLIATLPGSIGFHDISSSSPSGVIPNSMRATEILLIVGAIGVLYEPSDSLSQATLDCDFISELSGTTSVAVHCKNGKLASSIDAIDCTTAIIVESSRMNHVGSSIIGDILVKSGGRLDLFDADIEGDITVDVGGELNIRCPNFTGTIVNNGTLNGNIYDSIEGKTVYFGNNEMLDDLFVQGQLALGTDTPDASAALQIDSTTQGFLLPRLTTAQRDAILTPLVGLEIYNTTNNEPEFYNGSIWVATGSSSAGGTNTQIQYNNLGTLAGASFTYDGTNIRLPNSAAMEFGDSGQFRILYDGANGFLINASGDIGINNPTRSVVFDTALISQNGQMVIGSNIAPGAAVLLDLNDPNKALLLSRVADPTIDIATPLAGMEVYNTTSNLIQFYNGTVWLDGNGGSGVPGGSNTQVQFNNNGAFGGSADFTWDGSDLMLNANNRLTLGNASEFRLSFNGTEGVIQNGAGNLLIEATTGIIELDGNSIDIPISTQLRLGGINKLLLEHNGNGTIQSVASELHINITSGNNFKVFGDDVSPEIVQFSPVEVGFSKQLKIISDVLFIVGDGTNFRISASTPGPTPDDNLVTMLIHDSNFEFNNDNATGSSNFKLGSATSASTFNIQNNSGEDLLTIQGDGELFLNKGANFLLDGSTTATQSLIFTDNALLHQSRLSFNPVGGDLTVESSSDLILTADSVGVGTTSPDVKSKLQIDSTTSGFLMPRMTTAQRLLFLPDATINAPATGMEVYDTDLSEPVYFDGENWRTTGESAAAGPQFSIQFNDPLGTFNGNTNFIFDTFNNHIKVGDNIAFLLGSTAGLGMGLVHTGAAGELTNNTGTLQLLNVAGNMVFENQQASSELQFYLPASGAFKILDDVDTDIIVVHDTDHQVYITGGNASPHATSLLQVDTIVSQGALVGASEPVFGTTRFETLDPHLLKVGNLTTQTMFAEASYNGTFIITSVPDDTHYDVLLTFVDAGNAAEYVGNEAKGFLGARLTTAERDLIVSPATGLEIFNYDDAEPQYWNGIEWITTGTSSAGAPDKSIQFNSQGSLAGTIGVSWTPVATPTLANPSLYRFDDNVAIVFGSGSVNSLMIRYDPTLLRNIISVLEGRQTLFLTEEAVTFVGDVDTRVGIATLDSFVPDERLHVQVDNATSAVLKLQSIDGINGGASRSFVSKTDPTGIITANPGDICYLENGVNSDVFIYRAALAGSADWAPLGLGSVGPVGAVQFAIAGNEVSGSADLTWETGNGFLRFLNDKAAVFGDTNFMEIAYNSTSTRAEIRISDGTAFTIENINDTFIVGAAGTVNTDGTRLLVGGLAVATPNARLHVRGVSNDDRLATFENVGANLKATIKVGSIVPDLNIAGFPGDLYIYQPAIGGDSALYINKGATTQTSSTVGWEAFSATGAASDPINSIQLSDGAGGFTSSGNLTFESGILKANNIANFGTDATHVRVEYNIGGFAKVSNSGSVPVGNFFVENEASVGQLILRSQAISAGVGVLIDTQAAGAAVNISPLDGDVNIIAPDNMQLNNIISSTGGQFIVNNGSDLLVINSGEIGARINLKCFDDIPLIMGFGTEFQGKYNSTSTNLEWDYAKVTEFKFQENVLFYSPATGGALTSFTFRLQNNANSNEFKVENPGFGTVFSTHGDGEIKGLVKRKVFAISTTTNALESNPSQSANLFVCTDLSVERKLELSSTTLSRGAAINVYEFTVKDETGNASPTTPLKIAVPDGSGVLIDGIDTSVSTGTPLEITAPFGFLRLYSNGSNYFTM